MESKVASKNARFGYVLLLATPPLPAFAYYSAYRAGCLFDSKQGIGDFDASGPWSIAGVVAVLLAWLSLSLAVPLIAGPTIPRALGSVLFFGVLVLPLGLLLLLAGESSGVVACLRGP